MGNAVWFVMGFCIMILVVSISDTVIRCKAAVR